MSSIHEWLNPDIAALVFSYLPGETVMEQRLVCTSFSKLVTSNHVWKVLLSPSFLSSRAYIPPQVQTCIDAKQYFDAFKEIVLDRRRTHISSAQLTESEWYIRFKARAGYRWLANDPYHNGNPLPLMRFVGEPHNMLVRVDSTAWDGLTLQWRFVEREGYPSGSWLRVSNYPSLRVSRHPNGGFILQSLWLMYATFPLPAPGVDPIMDDAVELDALQLKEVILYRNSVPIPDSLVELEAEFAKLPDAAKNIPLSDLELI